MRAGMFLLCLLITGCSEDKLKPPFAPVAAGSNLPSQESWNASITFTDSGKVSAILHAGHISMFAERRMTKLDSGVVVDFFDAQGRHSSVLTAGEGQVNDVTHDFEARDNVVVVSDSGTTLKTEVLYWTNSLQKVTTPAFVDIVSPTEHIQGHGLESDQGLKHYTILKVTGQATTNE